MSKLSGHFSSSLVALPMIAILCAAVVMTMNTQTFAAGKSKLDVINKTEFDPNAERVELFSAMEDGKVGSKLVLKDSKGGSLLVTNNTQQPLTVAMPRSMVGVQVLKQLGGGGFGGGGLGGGAGGLGGGGAQTTGGGVGGVGGGGLGGGAGGFGGGNTGSLFSIPAAKTLSLNFNSVCLEHGKTEPAPRMEYTIAPVKSFSDDPILERLLVNVADQRIDKQVAQAAAWHLASDMSWGELAQKSVNHLGGLPPTSYFSQAQLSQAQEALSILTVRVQQEAEQNADENESEEALEKPVVDAKTAKQVSFAR